MPFCDPAVLLELFAPLNTQLSSFFWLSRPFTVLLIFSSLQCGLPSCTLVLKREDLHLQDTARSFGGSKADSERYRVYMEATQFDVIIEMLKLSEVDVDTIAARKKSLEKDIKVELQSEN